MRYSEIIAERLVVEQAFFLKDVKNRLMALNDQINEHLLLILSSEPGNIYINHWKNEVLAWLTNIYNMKIKTKGTPSISAKMYLYYMWDGPFGGHADVTITDMIGQLYRAKPGVVKNNRSTSELAQVLEQFHRQMAIIVEQRGDLGGLVNELK